MLGHLITIATAAYASYTTTSTGNAVRLDMSGLGPWTTSQLLYSKLFLEAAFRHFLMVQERITPNRCNSGEKYTQNIISQDMCIVTIRNASYINVHKSTVICNSTTTSTRNFKWMLSYKLSGVFWPN